MHYHFSALEYLTILTMVPLLSGLYVTYILGACILMAADRRLCRKHVRRSAVPV
jgi:hypothetical protein